jgi:iron only hydrogenase large subunit-like protein
MLFQQLSSKMSPQQACSKLVSYCNGFRSSSLDHNFIYIGGIIH